mgnify:CR=1 FL=1
MIATPNMKLWLPFERNANDFSGNGNNGTVSGASLVDGGKFGKCYSFDKIDDFIDCGNTVNPLQSFSICSYIYLNANTQINVIIGKTQTTGFHGSAKIQWYLAVLSSGILRFAWWGSLTNTSVYSLCESNATLDTGKWLFLTSTYDHTAAVGSRIQLYLNAMPLPCSNTISGNPIQIQNGSAHLGIGALLDSNGSRGTSTSFDGKIDNVLLFEKVLNQNDIKRIMLNLQPLNG